MAAYTEAGRGRNPRGGASVRTFLLGCGGIPAEKRSTMAKPVLALAGSERECRRRGDEI